MDVWYSSCGGGRKQMIDTRSLKTTYMVTVLAKPTVKDPNPLSRWPNTLSRMPNQLSRMLNPLSRMPNSLSKMPNPLSGMSKATKESFS